MAAASFTAASPTGAPNTAILIGGARRRGHQQHPGRGAGSKRGIPVFNAPGANANAVKELVLAGMFLAARNICQALGVRRAASSGDDQAIDEAVEKGKKNFVGFELPGRTLGVVGLGAIGVEVANAALALGMKVLGYDPQITVQRAWQLSSSVEQALSLDDLFARSDVDHRARAAERRDPRRSSTQRACKLMKKGGVVLEFRARARSSTSRRCSPRSTAGSLHAYVCDFPTNAAQGSPEGRRAAAPRRLDRRGRGELRRDGRRHAARVPRERQHPQLA